MNEKNNLLSIENLTINFGGLRALDDVFLNIAPNQVVSLIGPNGAGKTTLFNAICGLVKPNSGAISFEGKKIKWPKPSQLADYGIARTLQGVGLYSGLTVLENVMMGADKHKNSYFVKDL